MNKHELKLSERELIEISGVIEVINFSEEKIVLSTELGLLQVSGEDLNIQKLNLDDGELVVEGYIITLDYPEEIEDGGILSSLFK
jgi:sporulation protein YabP